MIWSLEGKDEWEEWLFNVGKDVWVLDSIGTAHLLII
jgi:hypothetical protein